MEATIERENKENVDDVSYYNNRELSWLSFNRRVLEEAMDRRNPLLERLKFMAIFSSNLDEFFMIRVAGLKDQIKAGFRKAENKAGLTPKQQLFHISQVTHEITSMQYQGYRDALLPELRAEGIHLASMGELDEKQVSFLETYFVETIFPVLTPMAVDAYHPFPKLVSKSLNLAVVLEEANERKRGAGQLKGRLAIVQVPAILKRFIELPSAGQTRWFILLEDIVKHFIGRLFQGFAIRSVTPFRITRNADLTIHEDEASDLLSEIEKELRKREWGAEVRLEVEGPHHERALEKILSRRIVLPFHHIGMPEEPDEIEELEKQ